MLSLSGSHGAFAFAFFCTIQCGKRFHPSLVSMGDPNANDLRLFCNKMGVEPNWKIYRKTIGQKPTKIASINRAL